MPLKRSFATQDSFYFIFFFLRKVISFIYLIIWTFRALVVPYGQYIRVLREKYIVTIANNKRGPTTTQQTKKKEQQPSNN